MTNSASLSDYAVDTLVDYAVCPGLALLNMTLQSTPVKNTMRRRMRPALHDAIIRNLDSSAIREKHLEMAVQRTVSDFPQETREKMAPYAAELLAGFNDILADNEYTLTGSVLPAECAYGGFVIHGAVDCTVRSERRGYIHPVIVDFSKTRYEPFFNPILYRCQVASDHLDLSGTNTDVLVFTLYPRKVWVYERKRYGDLVREALADMAFFISQDRFPIRFGWWCAGCDYRGICHKLLHKSRESLRK